MTLDPEEVLNNELVKYGPLCDTSFWATWAHESGAIMDWLLEKAEANGVVIGMPFTQYPEGVDPSKEPTSRSPAASPRDGITSSKRGRNAKSIFSMR